MAYTTSTNGSTSLYGNQPTTNIYGYTQPTIKTQQHQQSVNHGQTYFNNGINNDAMSDCYSSSHSGYNAVNSPRYSNLSNSPRYNSTPATVVEGGVRNTKCGGTEAGPRNCEFIEFFGEEFAGMEETFRSALLQYFTQVKITQLACKFCNNQSKLAVICKL